jgi:solute carrier family 25 citrate transporter 1
MQSLQARQQYRNSFHCAYRIFTEEGLLRFWSGTTPRLARLVVRHSSQPLAIYIQVYSMQLSGGITFSVYEKVIDLINGREVLS